MRLAQIFCVALAIGMTALRASAQNPPPKPYAPQPVLPPVNADGKLNWSTYYKSAALQAKYMELWHLGACRGTNKRIETPVAQNKLDINTLPEGAKTGVAAQCLAGGLNIVDAAQQVTTVVLHPAGVSRVKISGPLPPAQLAKGMLVRLVATVDAHGRSATPIEKLSVVSLPADYKPTELTAGSEAEVVGQVVDVNSKVLRLVLSAGKIRRVTLPLAEQLAIDVDAADVALVAPGDAVEVKGRLWDGETADSPRMVFASDVTVTKVPLVANAASKPPVQTAGR